MMLSSPHAGTAAFPKKWPPALPPILAFLRARLFFRLDSTHPNRRCPGKPLPFPCHPDQREGSAVLPRQPFFRRPIAVPRKLSVLIPSSQFPSPVGAPAAHFESCYGSSPMVLLRSPWASNKPRFASREDAWAEIVFAWASARAEASAEVCSNRRSVTREASSLAFTT